MLRRLTLVLCLFLPLLPAAEKKVVFPASAKPVGPYSPGILAGDFLYVSGQGARGPGGFPATTEAQIRQSLENVRSIVEAGGLTMEHIVYSQVYLSDVTKMDEVEKAWRSVFPKNPPARAVLGVARMPTDTPVEINAVAVRDLGRKRAIAAPGFPSDASYAAVIHAGDRAFVSGFYGRDPATGKVPEDPGEQVIAAISQMGKALTAAGLDFRHLVFVNPYLTTSVPMNVMNRIYARHFEFGNTPARATIQVNALPYGAHIEFTGVAVTNLADRKAVRPKNMAPSPTASPCVFAADTLYCSAKSGFIPGPHSGIYTPTVELQTRQTMRNLLDGLEEAGLTFANVVASNCYLDDIEEFSKFNAIYGQYFEKDPPSRTTVQQMPPAERKANQAGRWPTLEQVSVIAVK